MANQSSSPARFGNQRRPFTTSGCDLAHWLENGSDDDDICDVSDSCSYRSGSTCTAYADTSFQSQGSQSCSFQRPASIVSSIPSNRIPSHGVNPQRTTPIQLVRRGQDRNIKNILHSAPQSNLSRQRRISEEKEEDGEEEEEEEELEKQNQHQQPQMHQCIQQMQLKQQQQQQQQQQQMQRKTNYNNTQAPMTHYENVSSFLPLPSPFASTRNAVHITATQSMTHSQPHSQHFFDANSTNITSTSANINTDINTDGNNTGGTVNFARCSISGPERPPLPPQRRRAEYPMLLPRYSHLSSTSSSSASDRSNGSYWRSSRLKWPLSFILAAAVFSLTLSAMAFLFQFRKLLQKDEFCLPYESLKFANQWEKIDFELKMRVNTTDGISKYCVGSDDDLIHLVTLMHISDKMDTASKGMTSAHVALFAHQAFRHSTDKQTTLVMNTTAKLSYFNDVGVSNDNRTLVILTSGLYFVYSSIYFNFTATKKFTTCDALNSQAWVHHVMRLSPRKSKRWSGLIRTEHTCCVNCRVDQSSHFTGGVFYLLRGDRIMVSVSVPGSVLRNGNNSYLGLFLINQNWDR